MQVCVEVVGGGDAVEDKVEAGGVFGHGIWVLGDDDFVCAETLGVGDLAAGRDVYKRQKREFAAEFNSTVVAHATGADRNDPAAHAGGHAATVRAVKIGDPKVGDKVKLKSLGREARVERVITSSAGGKTFEVSVGTMKM